MIELFFSFSFSILRLCNSYIMQRRFLSPTLETEWYVLEAEWYALEIVRFVLVTMRLVSACGL